MKRRVAFCAALLTAVLYGSIVSNYGTLIRASTQRSADLQQAGGEDGRVGETASHLESLQTQLRQKVGRLTVADDSRSFNTFLQCVARVASGSHVSVVGLVPDVDDARSLRGPFAGRALTLRLVARFGEALQFVRRLPSAGVLLSIGDVAFSQPANSGMNGTPLNVTVRVTLLRFDRDPQTELQSP